jgi:hypothetical protein
MRNKQMMNKPMEKRPEQPDGAGQTPYPAYGHNRDRQDEIADMLECTTTVLERDELIAEYVELERQKVGQLDHPPPGGRQKTDKGIANAARKLEFLGESEEARRKLIERALKVAAICHEAKDAAIAAKLQNNHSALRAIAKAPPEEQMEKVQEITKRKEESRRARSSLKKALAPEGLQGWGDDAGDKSVFHDDVDVKKGCSALKELWRGTPPEARERFKEFLREEEELADRSRKKLPTRPTAVGGSNGNDAISAEESAERRKHEKEEAENRTMHKKVLETEVIGRRDWSEVVSRDGVRTHVTQLRPRALCSKEQEQGGGADSSKTGSGQ